MATVPAKTNTILAMETATVAVKKANAAVPKRMTFGEKDVVEALLAAHGKGLHLPLPPLLPPPSSSLDPATSK